MLSALLTVVAISAGLACKFYRGPASEWINDWGPASVAYELLLVFILFFVWPYRSAALRIAVGVFLWTCVCEFQQLWHPVWLESIRGTLLGRLALGTTFAWWDFPAYLVGSVLGWYCLMLLTRNSAEPALV